MVKAEATADLDWQQMGNPKGRIAGGKFLEELEVDPNSPTNKARPLQKVDCDIPLTHTDSIIKDGREWVVLEFAPNDLEDPFNWNASYKWLITGLLCSMTLFIGLATTAYSSGIGSMVEDLHTSTEMGELGLFLFNITCAIAPLFFAPFCELIGRRIVYVGGYFLFCICFIGLALGKNIGTILVLRAFLGLFGCIGTILVGGTFDDMFRPQDRAIPMACFAWIAILGTVSAPIYAGFVDQALGWRWLEGIQGLANIPLLIVVAAALTETRGSVTLQKRAKKLRADTGDDRWIAKEELEAPGLKEQLHNSSIKAIGMLVAEPVVFFFGLWIAFAWFITFLFLTAISVAFSENRHWGTGVAGLPYIALAIGCTLGFGLNFLQIRKYNSIAAKQKVVPPEARLYGAMCGAVFLPIGLFIFSFTQYAFVHWMGPCVGLACIGLGIFFVFESCYSFTSDCYGPSASSAIAGQGFMRNALGSVSPLFASQFFNNVGPQYAGLILSIIGTALTTLPFILFKFGPQIRARSSRAIRYDAESTDNEAKATGQQQEAQDNSSASISHFSDKDSHKDSIIVEDYNQQK